MLGNNHIGKELIEKLEEKRQSKVIVYFTGDRHPFWRTYCGRCCKTVI